MKYENVASYLFFREETLLLPSINEQVKQFFAFSYWVPGSGTLLDYIWQVSFHFASQQLTALVYLEWRVIKKKRWVRAINGRSRSMPRNVSGKLSSWPSGGFSENCNSSKHWPPLLKPHLLRIWSASLRASDAAECRLSSLDQPRLWKTTLPSPIAGIHDS